MLKKGNTEINKGYLGNQEAQKAYLGNELVFESNKQYALNLGGNVNQDYLSIPQSEKSWANGNEEFSYGITIKLPAESASNTYGLIGYTKAAPNNRWGIFFNTGILRFQLTDISFPYLNLYNDYSAGDIIQLSVTYSLNPNVAKAFVNGIEINSRNATKPTVDSSALMFIGAYGDATQTAPFNNFYFNNKIYSFFLGDDVFSVNEGSGFDTFSDLGTKATGQTSNAGGLTYWNSNVWQEL